MLPAMRFRLFHSWRARAVWSLLCAVFSATAWARPVSIAILHTTDVHGHILPTTDYEGVSDAGGFLRCAEQIDRWRAETAHTVLIDCGDTFQGAPESYLTRGRLLIDGLNRLNYDAWVLGNHEFDWGVEVLRDLHDQVEVPVLAANLYFRTEKDNWLPKTKPYTMVERDGVRIAVVGVTTPGIPRWSMPHLTRGALFRGSLETLRDLLPRLREQERPDILVVAVHQGYKPRGDDFANEVQAIAAAFPEIDVLLGGHSHIPVEDMRFGPVLYSQAGYHGIWAGRVDLVFDTVEKRVTEKRGVLKRMDATVPAHAGLTAAWSGELARVAALLSEPVGRLDAPLSATPDAFGRSPAQQFISQAIARATHADFVLHGALSDKEVPAGPLTYRDMWKIVPFENTLGVLSLTAAEIRSILDENLSRRISAMSLGPYGFTYEITHDAGVVMAGVLRDLEGQALHARRRYRVAFNSYVLASGGTRYLRVNALAKEPETRLEWVPVDTRSAVTELIREEAARVE
jgi:2',3'-cyclic-nucleotide 2'-phosphodiesterase/3'-nucleotidase